MYQNYIFDLYGTLADIRTNESKPYLYKKMAELYSALGANYNDGKEWKTAYRHICKQKKQESENPLYEIEISDVFRELFIKKHMIPSKETVDLICNVFRTLSRAYIQLYDGVDEFLELCHKKKKKVYLLSNAQAAFTISELKMLKIYDKFDGIVISSDVKTQKPDKAIMEALLDKYSLKVKQSIMIGNEKFSDIGVAKAVGMDSMYFHSNISEFQKNLAQIQKIKATYEVLDGDFKKIKGIILK